MSAANVAHGKFRIGWQKRMTHSEDSQLRTASLRGKARTRPGDGACFFDEGNFADIISLERKRSRRSMKHPMLMCMDISGLMNPELRNVRSKMQVALAGSVRDTDLRGWFKQDAVVGILFTDIESTLTCIQEILFRRVMGCLACQIDPAVLRIFHVTFLLYADVDRPGDDTVPVPMGPLADLAEHKVAFNLTWKLKSLMEEVTRSVWAA
jgi:hypothetical protein